MMSSTDSLTNRLYNERIEEFAFLEASYTIVRLLQTFTNVELVGEEESGAGERLYPKHTVTLVLASAKGCKVRLTA